jgi:tetratricopeptide (TPR) repeat protein
MTTPLERSAGQPGGQTAQVTAEAAELAIAYAKERQYAEALHYFQKVTAFTPEALSYYGLALAMRRQRLDDATEFCRQAIDRDPVRADFYFNLGQVYLARGEKKLAVRVLSLGLRVAPNHAALLTMQGKLGVRQPRTIDGLSRRNPLNRYLGWMRHKMKKAG